MATNGPVYIAATGKWYTSEDEKNADVARLQAGQPIVKQSAQSVMSSAPRDSSGKLLGYTPSSTPGVQNIGAKATTNIIPGTNISADSDLGRKMLNEGLTNNSAFMQFVNGGSGGSYIAANGGQYVPPGGKTTQPTQQSQAIQQAWQPQSLPTPFNAQQMLNDLYTQQRNAKLSALRNRITGQVNAAETQRIGLTPMFQQERSDADAQAIIAGKRLAEVMAQKGLGQSGENVTANIGLQNQRQRAFGDIGQRETTANAKIDAEISNLRQAGEGDIASMEADLAADKTGSLLDELRRQDDIARQNAIYNNQFGYQQYRDNVGDQRYASETSYDRSRDMIADSRYNREYTNTQNRYNNEWNYKVGQDAKAEKAAAEALAWSRSEGNPEYRRSLALAKVAELQAEALPNQQKIELEAARQKLATDKTLSEAQIAQIYANINKINTTATNGSSASVTQQKYNDQQSAEQMKNAAYSIVDQIISEGANPMNDERFTARQASIRQAIGSDAYNALITYANNKYAEANSKEWNEKSLLEKLFGNK